MDEVCEDEVAVTLSEAVDWAPEAPFHCGTAPLHVLHSEPDKLWLADLDPVRVGKEISQVRHVGSLLEVFSEFGQQWGARWMRHSEANLDHWQTVLDGLAGQVHFPPMELRPITLQDWRRAVRDKSARSVPGPDGLSREDLLRMPDTLTCQLIALCHVAEQQGSWPLQMLEGIVSSLEKTPQASKVSDFRPICVLSMVYRVWSSIRAKAALAHFARHAPPGMHGTLPGCNSSDVWMSLQLEVESTRRDSSVRYGLSADLTKAFNMLPRLPIFCLARLRGLPEALTRPWLAAITGLRRRFRVRGSVGPAVLSNCGFPEGDPLSCVAMCVANTAFHLHMSLNAAPSRTLTFVDNYESTSATFDGLVQAHSALMEFSRSWDMPVDTGKTVAWCTAAEGRSRLRAAGFQVVLDFRDLGAHLQTSRRFSNRTQVDRILSLDDRWPMLAASHAPVAQKIRALSTAAWPSALHAISVTPVGECHFSRLRSKAMRGITLNAPGANPLLQLSLVEYPVADPFFFTLRSSFMDLKCLAGPEVVSPLLTAAVQAAVREPGPAALLVARANAVGIAWCQLTGSFEDAFGHFDLWHISCAEIQLRLCFAWQQQIQERLRHRATFAGLHLVDPGMTRRIFNTFSSPDQAFLRISLNGTFFTNDALSHCGVDESKDCLFCGQPDSVQHRVCLCPHFQICRQEADVSADDLQALPQAQALHAWALASPTLHAVRRELAAIDGSFGDFQVMPEAEIVDLFTDGSCLKPREPNLRLATWAVVHGPMDDHAPSILVSAGLVPGLLQSPYRGELSAIVSALLFGWTSRKRVRIWTDCQALLRRCRRWQQGTWQPTQRSAHWDLWIKVVDIFEDIREHVSFHKVAAHQDWHDTVSFAEEWCARHNDAVDAAAGNAQALRTPLFWALWHRLCDETARAWAIGRKVMHLHVLVAKRAVLTKADRPPVVRDPPAPTAMLESYFGELDGPSVLQLSRRYGGAYIERLRRWSAMLHEEPRTLRWVSTLQLYILFCATWTVRPPVLRNGVWLDLADVPNGQYIEVALTQRVKFFQQTLRQFCKLSSGRWHSQEVRPASASLQARLNCVVLDISDALWHQVEEYLSSHLPDGPVRSHQRSWHSLPIPRGALL